VLSDIKSISILLHQYRIPLVVDEAHGAWLPFSHRPEDSALYQGADLVIQSLHKTLPALTQTALIHIPNPNCTDFREQSHTHAPASSQLPTTDTDLTQEQKERLACLDTSLRHYLSIFQTSSPSYLFMKNMEECVAWCDEHRKDFALFEERVHNFRIKVRLLHNMRLLEPSLSPNTTAPAYKMDPSRLVFLFDRITGEEAARWLEEHTGIVVEMSGVNFITAISTVMDSIEDFDTLFQGLQALDQYLDSYENIHLPDKSAEIMLNTEKGMVPLKDSLGLRIRDYVYVYPPGIPLIAPYEVITQEMIHEIKLQVNAGKEIR
jgi:arginine/lysine/ornithine decarboxylase